MQQNNSEMWCFGFCTMNDLMTLNYVSTSKINYDIKRKFTFVVKN